MNRQPTEDEVKKFWEWCGAPKVPRYPDGKMGYDYLDIDLNNLFKYAVPKLTSKTPLAYWIICLIEDWAEGKNPDPALALFWAIWEVIDG